MGQNEAHLFLYDGLTTINLTTAFGLSSGITALALNNNGHIAFITDSTDLWSFENGQLDLITESTVLGGLSMNDRGEIVVFDQRLGVGDILLAIPIPSPRDRDGDGVPDAEDRCPDTVIPEAVPTVKLGVNRFALTNADSIFDTVAPKGKGPQKAFTIADTAGCSCEQIIAMLDLGKGHTKFGCSIGAMKRWIKMVNP